MTRYLEECGRQWRLVQGKLGWEKQKEEEAKEEAEKKKEEKEKKKKQKKGRIVEVRKIAKEWEIWDEEEEAVRENAYKKIVGPCDRHEGGVYATKREGIPFVERRKRGG